jgi:hypothetical protein
MSQVETEAKRDEAGGVAAAVWSPDPAARAAPRRRLRVVPALVTLVTMALAPIWARHGPATARFAPMS